MICASRSRIPIWREVSPTVVESGVRVPMARPAGEKSEFWSRASRSIWMYSTGLPRPRGSNPRSPIMEPSRYAGGCVLGSHSWRSAAEPRPGALVGAAFLAGADFLVPKEGFFRVRVPFLAMKTLAPLETAETADMIRGGVGRDGVEVR